MSDHLDRREFVKIVTAALGTIMGAIVGLPAIGYLISPALRVQKNEDWISVGPLEKYPVGKPTLFSFTRSKVNGWEKTVNSYGVYVVRTSETEYTIFSNMCTHLSCRVNWKDESQEYICPCHDGHFGQDGSVTAGPPPKPLIKYEETKIEDGNLMFFFKES